MRNFFRVFQKIVTIKKLKTKKAKKSEVIFVVKPPLNYNFMGSFLENLKIDFNL